MQNNTQFGLTKTAISKIINVIKNYNNVEEVILFGSRALGNFKKGSDIDLAIKGKDLNFSTISSINYQLNEEIPVLLFFDVVNYNSIDNQSLKQHINEFGKSFFIKNK